MSENNVRTTGSTRLNRLRSLLPVLCGVAIPLGCYLFFFVAKANFREVVPQKVYRSAQPSPAHLKEWVRRHGIRTVINLRGDSGKITEDEQAALGVKMIVIRLTATKIPSKNSLAELIQTIEAVELPVLIHCHSGVDRSGTASALAAMAIGKDDYDKARWQAYVPPGPWKRKRQTNYAHISDVLKLYEFYCRRNGLNTNGWQQFKQWAMNTETLAEEGMDYKFTCSYFPQFDKTRRFFPIAKLARGAGVQFAVESALLTLLAFGIYRRLLKTKVK